MRIEQYFLMTDYSLWEVILNGDSPIPTRVVDGVIQPVAPTTAEQRLAKKNELKARGTLLIALSDKHQLKFNIHKDAKSLMEAIEKRFGGNKETKKVQKTLLKQQYEKFIGSSSESLDQIHDSLQKLTANCKFLLDNDDLKQIDADDLEEMDLKWQMVMLTMRARRKRHFVRGCRSSRDTRNKDTQRRNVPVETSTSNALVSQCDGVGRYYWSFQTDEEPKNYALMAFTSSSSSSSDNEVAPCSQACSKAYATLQSYYDKLTNDLRKSQFDVLFYKTCLESIEARLVVYQQNESVFEEDIKLLKLDVMLRDNALVELRKKFEKAEQERDELKLKFKKFQTSSKNLSKLLASQITDKTGLGYDNQVFNSTVFDCDELISSELDVSMPTSPVHDMYKSGEGYHVSDSEDEFEGELMPTQKAPSFVQTYEHVKTPRPSVKPLEHPIPVENLRKDIPKYRGHSHSWNRKACFVCKSFTHLIKDCNYYEKKMIQKLVRNHAMRGHLQHYARMTHPHPHRHVVPTTVLTRSRLVPLTAARPVTTAVSQTKVQHQRPTQNGVNKAHSPIRRTINLSPSPKYSNFDQKVTTVKDNQVNAVKGVNGNWGNLQHALKDKRVIDSGCSRHMIGNISYLSDFEEINGGYVAFGGNPKGGKITGKGKIRTGKLDVDDVYFVKELKFNLFSVSQMCDKKNIVLFTDTECIVLSSDFKLPHENHVLLRVPRENNMLGHINLKAMNKPVKGNLVRGLPSKVFENNHTCVACKKGKQHRASCKSKPISSVSQPLQRLHMDLFGPTFVKSLNKKSYCLVVTDDYNRFSWVFFLTTKDETSTILKTFMTGIKNQINHRVKIIRSDNGTEFKNQDLNQFCGMKRINREYNVAKTPQQNGIAKRKNRTLIEVARTMLADSLLPIPFWAEVDNTACYVQNRVLVTKPNNKTPYELLLGRTPSIGFMRPFGYPVTILNTLDPLGKFDGNADKGFLVRYSVNNKAFRVLNSRTRIVQETLRINFLENQPNITGSRPTWLFDIDTLTQSMNYQPVIIENQPNSSVGIQENLFTDTIGKEADSIQQYVLLPLWSFSSKVSQNTNADAFDVKEPESTVYISPCSSDKTKKHDEKTKREAKGKSPIELSTGVRYLSDDFEEYSDNSTNGVNAASTPVTTVGPNSTNNTNTFGAAGPSITAVSPTFGLDGKSLFIDHSQYPDDPDMPHQTKSMTRMVKEQGGLTQTNDEDFHTCMFACVLSQEEPKRVHQALKDPSWIEATQEELFQFKMKKEEGIDYEEVFAPVVRIKAIRLFLAYASFMDFMVYQMDVKSSFLYGTIKEEVYVCQPPGFEDPDHLDMVYKVVKALYELHQAPRAWYEILANYLLENGFQRGKIDQTLFIRKQKGDICWYSQDKYVAEILRKFGLTDGKSASTPIDTEKPLLKDPDGEDVDVHTYRSMIGSLIHLTLPRPDIMFAVCGILKLHICMQSKGVLDISKYTYPALIQKVFANMRRVGKGFSGVDTPLFDGMLVPQQAQDVEDAAEDEDDVTEGRLEESQAKVYHLDLEHADKVLSMQETDEPELAEVEEVIEVVTAAKLMTEVVTTAATAITAATVPKANAPRRRRGVIIQDPKEATTASVTVQSERKERQDNTVMRYQALKRKPITEAQARKNMMVYLKNMAGFKMDFFRRMTYTEIRSIFEKHYNSIQAFLEKGEKEIEEEGSKRKSKSSKQRAAKKKYPLIRFTLEQMLNNVKLEVEEESEMSLELLRLMRRQQQEGYKPE
nr:hypothetical protein [Tanacetum cinerariifolium]